LTEHDEDDDASQAEDSQPHNRAVKSITTDKEDKDIEAKGNKKVKIIETDKSENKQTIMYTYVWIRENKIMRTVNHSMTLLIA
jgi:hypothetical protein